MTFLHPAFLWGLTALAIPIVVHLFNFRRYRTLYFSNTQFLKELHEETRRQSQLKKWIILFLRMAAITSLVLAFAQPVPKTADFPFQHGNAYVQLYIDDSFSMENQAEQGSLLHEAAEKAKALADAFGEDAVFMLVTNDLEAKHARFISRTEIKKEISRLTTSPHNRDLKQILQYSLSQMEKAKNPNRQLFLFSDFQKSTCPLEKLPSDSSVRICMVPLHAHRPGNFFIDSCWFDQPVLDVGQNVRLSLLLRNETADDVEKMPVKLYINGQQKAIASADLKAHGRALLEIPFTLTEAGWQQARLEITDYPVTFDDRLYFSFRVNNRHPVLRIFEKRENPFLQALFATDSAIEYRQLPLKQMDYGLLSTQDLVILDQLEETGSGFQQQISNYVENGGTLLLIPSAKNEKALDNNLNQALQITQFTHLDTQRSRLSSINSTHALYRNTFENLEDNIQLPLVFKHYRTDKSLHGEKELLLTLENGDELLSVQPKGMGAVYLLTVPMEENFSEWPRHALFVPSLYNMAMIQYNSLQLYYTIGKEEAIPFANESLPAQAAPELIGPDNFSCIPALRDNAGSRDMFVYDQIREAGNYAVIYRQDTLQQLSFNFARNESEMDFWTSNELKDAFKGAHKEVFDHPHASNSLLAHQLHQESRSSNLFIWLTLFFLLLETILLRVWKNLFITGLPESSASGTSRHSDKLRWKPSITSMRIAKYIAAMRKASVAMLTR